MAGRATQTWMRQLPALLLALLAASAAISAERPWRRLDAAHYLVLSQLGDRETVAWTRDFNQFIASISGVLHIDLRQLPPLTVVLFARDQDFEAYKLTRPNGRTANVGGQFVRKQTWSVIGLPGVGSDRVRQTIYHEATHWLMSVDEARQPAWFSEGIAELLSTFEYHGKEVNWAKPMGEHLNTLYDEGTAPLREFLTQPSAIFNRDDRTEVFYAQAWAFTHFLLFSDDPSRAQLLSRFLEVFKTHSGDATVDEVFGANLPAVEKAFQRYAKDTTFRYYTGPASPVADPSPPVPATAQTVQTALGFLALGANRNELAREHARKAIELDAGAPGGHEILAYLAMDEKDFDKAAGHAEDALRGGSKDSQLYMLLADSFISGANANRPDAERQRADLYEKAINLNPRRGEPYDRLTAALFNLDEPTANDAKLVAQGLVVFPGNDWLRVGAAAVAFRQGRRDEGREAMARALQPGSTLDDSQRRFASGFLRSLSLQQLNADLRDALDRQDVPAVRAAAEQLLAEPDLPAQTREMLQKLRDTPPAPPIPPASPPKKSKKK